MVHLRTARVVDAGHDVFHSVGLAGDTGSQDVAVVAAAHGSECVRALDTGVLQGFSIEPDTGDRAPAEVRWELPER